MPTNAAIQNYVAGLTPSWLDKFVYYCIPLRKKIVLANLQRVFSDQLSQQQIVTLAQCFYGHLVRSLRENLWMRFQTTETIRQCAEVIGHEKVLNAAKQGKGVILLTGHFGNWELAPIAGIAQFKQFQGRFHFVRRMLRYKLFERILFRRYYAAGLHVIPSRNSLSQVCAALEQQDAVVFVLDQHANIDNRDGIVVDFFGQPAGTYRSLASIVRYTQVPVIPTTTFRRADGKHVLQFFDPIEWQAADNAQHELALNTQAYNNALEQIILSQPEQWLWLHKRWKV